MIQRIQTLWLLLAAACALASFKFSFYSGVKLGVPVPHDLKAGENMLLIFVSFAIGTLALITLVLFKKRTVQMRLCVLGIVLEALLIFLYYREVQTFASGTYSLAAILQTIILISFFLAARGINRDEKMVKDSERLR